VGGLLSGDFLCFCAEGGAQGDVVCREDLKRGGLRIVDGDIVGQVLGGLLLGGEVKTGM